MIAASSRYLRYILFTVFGVFIIYILSSSSIPNSITRPTGYFGTTSPLAKQPTAHDGPPAEKNPSNPLHLSPEHSEVSSSDATTSAPSTLSTPSLIDTGSSANPANGLAPAIASGPRMNATFVTLARNGDLWELVKSIRHVEDRFNRNYHYDWVFLNNDEFDDEFKKVTSALVSGTTHYGLIPQDHWSFPDFIDQEKAAAVREDMKARKIIYGDSISYRHMCRYESGFFFRHELMNKFEWYWRVEPSVELFCDISYDPFKYMVDNKKKYSFVLSLYEYAETIPTLWDSAKMFIKRHPEHIAEGNSLAWVSEDGGDTYNHCHFWSNFEIGNLDWFRSQAYLDYFNYLDRDGGFFYERWGDAPVHSIAAAIMLKKEEIHFFNDIAYYHVPFTHCPTGEDVRLKLKCHCNPKDNFDWKSYSCTSKWHDVAGVKKPAGWESEMD